MFQAALTAAEVTADAVVHVGDDPEHDVQGARDAGAQWRVDGGDWQISGATVSGLSVDTHTVEYSSITGWATPANEGLECG